MKRPLWVLVVVLLAIPSLPVLVTAEPTLPASLTKGASLFSANCARCHGAEGKGTAQGPPLVHKIYEPNHHADIAFYRAAEQGVRAHHWNFGDMPKVVGVTREDLTQIIAYIRWLQKQAGIF